MPFDEGQRPRGGQFIENLICWSIGVPQRLKPKLISAALLASLKRCPDTNRELLSKL